MNPHIQKEQEVREAFAKEFRPKIDNTEFGWSSQDMGGYEMVLTWIFAQKPLWEQFAREATIEEVVGLIKAVRHQDSYEEDCGTCGSDNCNVNSSLTSLLAKLSAMKKEV